MLTKQSLTLQLQAALGNDHDSLVPHLALVIAQEIMPLQRELEELKRKNREDFDQEAFDRAAELLGDKIAEVEEVTFAGKLRVGDFYELLRKSRESVAENGGQERQRLLREIAAEYNTRLHNDEQKPQ